MKLAKRDPAHFLPSSAAIRERLESTEQLAARLRILLNAAEQLQELNQGGDAGEFPKHERLAREAAHV